MAPKMEELQKDVNSVAIAIVMTVDDDENDWEVAPVGDFESHALTNAVTFDSLLQSQNSTPDLPAQLHPAVTLGMKRVSSCYFSISGSDASNSVADLLSLVDEHEFDNDMDDSDDHHSGPSVRWNASEVLYHDIMMHVFTFLDLKALAAFSQTARRPNFECFYFLQLQLQSSLVAIPDYYALAGTAVLSRVSQRDEPYAQNIVQNYLDSNSTLRHMPLSHSLAYIRHVLERHGFQQHISTGSPSHALASAALLITLIGAASVMGTDSSYSTMLPNMLKVGLAGSLMRAGVTATTNTADQKQTMMPMRETAERLARMMQELPSQILEQLHSKQTNHTHQGGLMGFPTSIAARIYGAFSSSYGPMEQQETETSANEVLQVIPLKHPISPNPYDNLPSCESSTTTTTITKSIFSGSARIPSGCVAAYSRAIRQAKERAISMLREERKVNFAALSVDEQLELTRSFLEACSSDQSLRIVEDIVRIHKSIDVDGFHLGPDGTEICALHTAAFHGAYQVVDFLCQGLSDDGNDGGLADVNVRDANGWTALHFAAGADSVETVRILAAHGARLAIEANNGYTPFHWAQRLSNMQVAEELQRLGGDQRFLLEHSFSNIANRLFRSHRVPAA
jgi:Ankyrin repeats (3 copies)